MAAGTVQRHHRHEPDHGGRGKKLKLGAFFIAGELQEFDCSRCASDPDIKKYYGCGEPGEMEIEPKALNVGTLNQCPVSMLTRDTMAAMKYYGHYKNGYLPRGGGVLDQTGVFVKAVEIIGGGVNKILEAKAKARTDGK